VSNETVGRITFDPSFARQIDREVNRLARCYGRPTRACLGCKKVEALERDICDLAEWECAKSQSVWEMFCELICPEPIARKRGFLALEVMHWLAAEESRIWTP